MFDLAFRSSRPASQRALSDNLQRKAHFVKRTNGNVNSFVGYQSLRNFSPATQACYVYAVSRLARYHKKSPDQLSKEDIRAFLVHLTVGRFLLRFFLAFSCNSSNAFTFSSDFCLLPWSPRGHLDEKPLSTGLVTIAHRI